MEPGHVMAWYIVNCYVAVPFTKSPVTRWLSLGNDFCFSNQLIYINIVCFSSMVDSYAYFNIQLTYVIHQWWLLCFERYSHKISFNNVSFFFRLHTPSLWWRHNDHDSVSNHQPHECLLDRLFRRSSKKTSKLRVTGFCVGNSPGPVNSPHKGPVTRKMFPFDDVIM